MTRDIFTAQMRRMNGLRFPPADLGTHWEGLSDLPIDVLTRAIERSIRTRSDFPTPAELRLDADASRTASQTPVLDPDTRLATPVVVAIPASALSPARTITITSSHTYYCDICSDSGWSTHWCGSESPRPWLDLSRCDRWNPTHAPHDWSGPCPCAATNPTIRARQARAAVRFAEEPQRQRR